MDILVRERGRKRNSNHLRFRTLQISVAQSWSKIFLCYFPIPRIENRLKSIFEKKIFDFWIWVKSFPKTRFLGWVKILRPKNLFFIFWKKHVKLLLLRNFEKECSILCQKNDLNPKITMIFTSFRTNFYLKRGEYQIKNGFQRFVCLEIYYNLIERFF